KALTFVLRRRLKALQVNAKTVPDSDGSTKPASDHGASVAVPDGNSPVKAASLPDSGSPTQQQNPVQKMTASADLATSSAVVTVASAGSGKTAPAQLQQISSSLEELGKKLGEGFELGGKDEVLSMLLVT